MLCDDGGVANNARRLVQEMIVNDKVGLIGIGTTLCSLAVAPLVTEAKIATLVLSSGASVTVTKSPYMVPAGFLQGQQAWIMAEWAFNNGSKRVVTLVNDWARASSPKPHSRLVSSSRAAKSSSRSASLLPIPISHPSCSVSAHQSGHCFHLFFGHAGRHFRQAISRARPRQSRHQDHRPRRSDGRRRNQHHGRPDARHQHVRLVFGRPRFGAQQGLCRRLRGGIRLSSRTSTGWVPMTACI